MRDSNPSDDSLRREGSTQHYPLGNDVGVGGLHSNQILAGSDDPIVEGDEHQLTVAPISGVSNDKTVISQRPIAAPEEFYRSMPLSDLAELLEGKNLDHFAVEQMIGGGGMGAVFRGRDLRLDRIVAIKVIPASRRDPETLRRFRLEAQSAARLDHPNIARVYYVGEAEQWNYIVFEFIDGVNIRELVEMEGPLSIDEAVYYTRQVAEALQHAQERDVVHRDIKPSNVLVTAAGIAKLVDMGLARTTALDHSTTDATASGITLGTFDYISPEQARNPREADVRSDLYSLGCTLFFMLTGRPPFPEGTALQKLLSHGSEPPPDVRNYRDDISDQLFEIIMKLMSKRPLDRYQKPIDLISDLLLLAEIEELPRSRSVGQVIVASAAFNQTILESHLPWIVALAALIGSTLWLQSMQALSNRFTLPDIEFSRTSLTIPADADQLGKEKGSLSSSELGSRANVDAIQGRGVEGDAISFAAGNSRSDSIPTIGPETGEIAMPEELLSNNLNGVEPLRIVVSEKRPIGENGFWVDSLADALARAQNDGQIREIVVVGRHVLNRSIKLENRTLTLRGLKGSDPVIEVAVRETLLGSRTGPAIEGAIALSQSTLICQDLAFRFSNPEGSRVHDLFVIRDAGGLQMHRTSITLQPMPSSGKKIEETLRAIAVVERNVELDTAIPDRPSESANIQFRDSLVRGSGNLVHVEASRYMMRSRIEISCSNLLVAITGVVLSATESQSLNSGTQYIRWYCSKSSFISNEGFASLVFSGDRRPSLGISRESEDCVFWSHGDATHILAKNITAAQAAQLDFLLLQGNDNSYDQNIRSFCRCLTLDGGNTDWTWSDAMRADWYRERAVEQQINWSQPTSLGRPFVSIEPSELEVEEGMYMPGISTSDLTIPL
ncbi:MAG: serine/threonine protein kinase [Planctomycetales bacterium]|nr:serine/threonine protein kinase [Planctomycetales bacterium]